MIWGSLVALLVIWVLCDRSASLLAWTIATLLGLVLLNIFGAIGWKMSLLLWPVTLISLTALNVHDLRLKYIISPLYRYFKNVLPILSRTEQEALDAGDVGFEAELFQGRPRWQTLIDMPKNALSEAELKFLSHQVETLCGMLDDWTITQKTMDLPPEAWAYLKKEKFFGMIIPKVYGGLEFSALANSTIVQKITSRSLSAGVSTMVPNSLGPAELLLHYGTEAQKKYYLPKLAVGEEIPCFALTGPEAGSDAGAIPDMGVVCKGQYEGKEIIGMRLTWNKRYITLAPVATVLGLAFKLYDPEGLLGRKKDLGITLCLIPAHYPGVEIGKRHLPLNQPFMNGPTSGCDVFVPLDWIIGGPEMAGKGWSMIVECLAAGRGISLPAVSSAAAKMSCRVSSAYAKVRQQFHTSIGRFEGVEAALSRIAGFTYLIEATRLFTLSFLDQGIRPAVATAISKYHMTELARVVVNDAMDIHGGRAIMLGPNNYLGNCYQSMPISVTVEGANILTRNLIIFGQGAIRCHPYLRAHMAALNNPNLEQGLAEFDNTFGQHIKFSLSVAAKTIFHAWTGGIFCKVPVIDPLTKYVKSLTRLSLALSFVSEVALLKMGGKLKRRERLSARLGDILSYLYMASAVVKYSQDFGNTKSDIPFIKWTLETCLYRIEKSFFDFFRNFKSTSFVLLFKLFAFPYGRRFRRPADSVEHSLATTLMTPSPFRDRLTQYCYHGTPETDAAWQLEETFKMMIDLEPLLQKLEGAEKRGEISKRLSREQSIKEGLRQKLLTEDEAATLLIFEAARQKAIAVDAFSRQELKKGEL